MVSEWARWIGERPARRDAATAALWLVLGATLWAVGAVVLWPQTRVVDAPTWVFLCTLIAAVVVDTQRSRWPVLVLTLGTAIALCDLLLGGSLAVVIVFTDVVYAAVRFARPAQLRVLLRVVGPAAAAVALTAAITVRDERLTALLIQWALFVLVSGLWGWTVRSEGDTTRARLAAQHARETAQLRARLAHELHDLVANQIAVAGLHIEAAKLQSAQLQSAELQSAELQSAKQQSGVEVTLQATQQALLTSLDRAKRGTDLAHQELRSLIGVLSAVEELIDTPDLTFAEELRELDGLLPAERRIVWEGGSEPLLVQSLTAAGSIDHGAQSSIQPGPGSGAQRMVLPRVLRELVTNAAKHGHGEVHVHVWADEGRLHVELRNPVSDRATPVPASAAPGNGLGLGGVRLLLGGVGGALETTKNAAGTTWVARVTVPTAVRPAATPAVRPAATPAATPAGAA